MLTRVIKVLSQSIKTIIGQNKAVGMFSVTLVFRFKWLLGKKYFSDYVIRIIQRHIPQKPIGLAVAQTCLCLTAVEEKIKTTTFGRFIVQISCILQEDFLSHSIIEVDKDNTMFFTNWKISNI